MDKKLFVFLFVFMLITGCFRAPIPEVEVITFYPLTYYYGYDTVTVDTLNITTSEFKKYKCVSIGDTLPPDTFRVRMLRYRAIIDSISFVIKNKVDVMIRGYYIEFFKETDVDTPKRLYITPYYAIGPIIWGSDTTTYTLFDLPIPCWNASVHLETDTTIGSIRMHVVFYGEDIYNNRNIEGATADFGLIKAK